MAFLSWLGSFRSASPARKASPVPGGPSRQAARLSVEQLEDRCVLSAGLNPAIVPTPPVVFNEAVAVDSAPKGNPQVVFLGDSITALYGGSPSYAQQIAPLGAIDLAVPGNTTGNILWQLDNGALKGTAPKTIVLMIGINNLIAGQTPLQTAEGVAADLLVLRTTQPQAEILLLGILPAGILPNNPWRIKAAETNSLIAAMADGVSVHYLDFGAAFLQPNGTIAPQTMFDGVHPTPQAFQRYTDAILQTLPALTAAPRTVTATTGSYGILIQTSFPNGTVGQLLPPASPFPGTAVYASTASSAAGQVVDAVLADGTLFQFSPAGAFSWGVI